MLAEIVVCKYHGSYWMELVEQGYVTRLVYPSGLCEMVRHKGASRPGRNHEIVGFSTSYGAAGDFG